MPPHSSNILRTPAYPITHVKEEIRTEMSENQGQVMMERTWKGEGVLRNKGFHPPPTQASISRFSFLREKGAVLDQSGYSRGADESLMELLYLSQNTLSPHSGKSPPLFVSISVVCAFRNVSEERGDLNLATVVAITASPVNSESKLTPVRRANVPLHTGIPHPPVR
ncbi:hypothetical protein CEXT_769011 [Caerostris extrusa]|uniref:Uncharacterized protein n=1 Tax=Caerostris extrusa TaxID=172846 RepID=A0AAV4V647_CAEEX|nr:hypothetical protein CEXT_769011 [Caerostris extrusa]